MGKIEDFIRQNSPLPDDPKQEEMIPPAKDEQKEKRDRMGDAIMEASAFMAAIDILEEKAIDRSTLNRILGACNKHLGALMDVAPLFVDDKPITKDGLVFEWYRDAEDVYGRLWRLHFRLAGISDIRGTTIKADIREALRLAAKSFPDWQERSKVLSEVTTITKGGGGEWQLENGVTLLDFAVRARVLAQAIQRKEDSLKKREEELLESIDIGEELMKRVIKGTKSTKRNLIRGSKRARSLFRQLELSLKKALKE